MLSAGLGWHVLKSPTTTFDLFGGLGYTVDNYRAPMAVGGELRDRYQYASLPLGEESTHKLSATTSARQRLVVVANLRVKPGVTDSGRDPAQSTLTPLAFTKRAHLSISA